MATVKLDPAKGVQIPNMTTTERNAVSSPETGALIWNTTTSAVNQYNGSAWGTVGISEDTTKLPLAGGTMTGNLTAPNINVADDIVHTGDADTYLSWNANNLTVYNGGTNNLYLDNGQVVFNEGGGGVDFRIEGSGAANAFFVKGSDGNVGIGTNSPTVVDAAATGLHIHGDSNATNRAQLHLTSATTGSSGTDGMYILYDGVTPQIQVRENQPLVFWLNGSERMRVLSSGGLTFNGDTAAANALDDYEEGSWTPSFVAYNGTNPTIGSSANYAGRYTKIGNLVTIGFELNNLEVTGTTGGLLLVSSLPFSIEAGTCYAGAFTSNNINMVRTVNKAWVPLGTAGFGLLSSTNANGWGWESCSIATAGSAALRGSVTYRTP